MNTANQLHSLATSAIAAILLGVAVMSAAADAGEKQASVPVAAASCCQTHSAAADETPVAPPSTTADPVARLAKTWGIEITSLRLSAEGYFVDFRYKVIDPEKAAPLLKAEAKPYLIDEASGNKLGVPTTPKLGPLRQTAQRLAAGRIYYIFFGNSRGIVKPGAKVTVVIGDCRIENVTIG